MIESPSYKLHKLVFSLEREARKIVKKHVGISYKRVVFLIVLGSSQPLTQHKLADILGYSDAAVSLMLTELKVASYVTVTPSADHGRKRIVSLTPAGEAIAKKASAILDEKFAQLGEIAGADLKEYAHVTEQLYQALITKETRKGKG